jgi:hypothetical protein
METQLHLQALTYYKVKIFLTPLHAASETHEKVQRPLSS